MQPQLLFINDDAGKGVDGRDGTQKKREGSPLSNLELGIGSSRRLRGVVKEEKGLHVICFSFGLQYNLVFWVAIDG